MPTKLECSRAENGVIAFPGSTGQFRGVVVWYIEAGFMRIPHIRLPGDPIEGETGLV
jgi:hypothetical protein